MVLRRHLGCRDFDWFQLGIFLLAYWWFLERGWEAIVNDALYWLVGWLVWFGRYRDVFRLCRYSTVNPLIERTQVVFYCH